MLELGCRSLLVTVGIDRVGVVGVRVLFTCELFTSELFTVHSGVLHLSAVAVSSDVVPVHCVPVGLSNIKEQGSQSQVSMIGRSQPSHEVGSVTCMQSALYVGWLYKSLHYSELVA